MIPLKRKKRSLTTRPTQQEEDEPPITRKKRRQLNTPLISLDLDPVSSSRPSASKRSLRRASEAIDKREQQRQTNTTKAVKRKRKLLSQKVVLPSPDDETGDVSYSAYLGSPERATVAPEEKPAIVLGLPTRRRLIPQRAQTPTLLTQTTSTLDLSQHTILPIQPPPPPPPQGVESDDSDTSILSNQVTPTIDSIHSDHHSITSTTSSLDDGPVFFDAINHFDDMVISEEQRENILGFEPTNNEQTQTQEASAGNDHDNDNDNSGSFWRLFFKPFF